MKKNNYNSLLQDADLAELYYKWCRDPRVYESKLLPIIDRIISYVLALHKKNRQLPIINKFQDIEDLQQDLRLFSFKLLAKIQPPVTSKRVFNYLKVSLKLYLMDKARAVAKHMDRESELDLSSIRLDKFKYEQGFSSNFSFENETQNKISTLLIEGYTKKEIIKLTKLDAITYDEALEKIKQELICKNPDLMIGQ